MFTKIRNFGEILIKLNPSYSFELITLYLGTKINYIKIHNLMHRFLNSMNGVALVTKIDIFVKCFQNASFPTALVLFKMNMAHVALKRDLIKDHYIYRYCKVLSTKDYFSLLLL